jgi:hypothetical protein
VFVGYDAATGTDYNCNYKEEGVVKSFCKREGEVIALMDECDRNPGGRCDGFVVSLESNSKFGVLKRVPGGRDKVVERARAPRFHVLCQDRTQPYITPVLGPR